MPAGTEAARLSVAHDRLEGASRLQRLAGTAQEDAARLVPILRELGCGAHLRSPDGTIVPLIGSKSSGPRSPTGRSEILSAPVHDEHGEVIAVLEIDSDEAGTSASQRLLCALVRHTARAISERWFRICHRRCWILVAKRHDRPGAFVTLAVDRDQQVVGADRDARQILAGTTEARLPLPLSAFFGTGTPLLTGRRYCDHALQLRGTWDGAAWCALITPPDLSPVRMPYNEGVLLHARPRLDRLESAGHGAAPAEAPQGLPPRMLSGIQEYIDANLESTLKIGQLARRLAMSTSHFARAFRKSVGLTPHSYVMQRRLARAQELLASTDLALAEIALKTGFSDQSHFSRRFHQLMGLPPRAFRVQQR